LNPKKYTDKEKYCPRCDSWLAWSEFSKDKSRCLGVQAYCRICDFCRKHKMTRILWLELLKKQNNICAFPGCDKEPAELDHDHKCCPGKYSCGKCIRGALCSKHNMALGQFNDSIKQLKQAISYLESYDGTNATL
jgi:hypothetical protein